MLYHAVATIGAIWTSISPDLGLEGCVSRLQQVTTDDAFRGQSFDIQSEGGVHGREGRGDLEKTETNPGSLCDICGADKDKEIANRRFSRQSKGRGSTDVYKSSL